MLNLIWVCKKDTTWKSLSEYIYLETWIYLIRIFSRPLLFNTTFYQTFLFDKIIKTEALCDLLLDTGFAFTHIIRHMSMGDHNISHPAIECPVLAHFGPVHQESVVRTSPAVRSSELGIHYMTLTIVKQLHIWCQMKYIWFKFAFDNPPSNLFIHVYKWIFLKAGKCLIHCSWICKIKCFHEVWNKSYTSWI